MRDNQLSQTALNFANTSNDVHLHACSSQLLSPLVDGRVNNVLLQTGRTSINKALFQLFNVFHMT